LRSLECCNPANQQLPLVLSQWEAPAVRLVARHEQSLRRAFFAAHGSNMRVVRQRSLSPAGLQMSLLRVLGNVHVKVPDAAGSSICSNARKRGSWKPKGQCAAMEAATPTAAAAAAAAAAVSKNGGNFPSHERKRALVH